MKSKILPILTLIGLSLYADTTCRPQPASPCYTETCSCIYCLGPKGPFSGNPQTRPKTCNGDIAITLAGFYWIAHQDGMEYALKNDTFGNDAATVNLQLNNLINAQYLSPHFKWDFGFKLGLAYNFECDGWDIGTIWTWYRGKAASHVEAEEEENITLQPLWSGYQFPSAGTAPILFATDIETFWRFKLNLVDIELGREFWTSKLLSFRPHIGFRYGSINQDYEIKNRGGSYNDPNINRRFNDRINLKNYFHGLGLIAGFDTTWNLGCGWGFFSNLALSIIYGRFTISHDETLREARAPFSKIPFLETKESFRNSKPILDLVLGIQWARLLCDCAYALTVSLAWENHLFFHQNQLWRVTRVGGQGNIPLNNSGENVFYQNRGDLAVQGWTLKTKFEF